MHITRGGECFGGLQCALVGYLTLEALKLKEIKGLSPSTCCFSTKGPFCFLLQFFGIVENL